MYILHSDMSRPSRNNSKFLEELVDHYHSCAANAPRDSDNYADHSSDDVRILKPLTMRIVYFKL